MVPGNHDRANPRVAALFNRVLHLGPDGVNHPAHADPGQVLLQFLRRVGGGPFIVDPLGGAQHPQRLVGHRFVLFQDAFTLFACQGDSLAFFPNPGTAAQHLVRRAFGELDKSVPGARPVQRGHHLAQGIKRRLIHPR